MADYSNNYARIIDSIQRFTQEQNNVHNKILHLLRMQQTREVREQLGLAHNQLIALRQLVNDLIANKERIEDELENRIFNELPTIPKYEDFDYGGAGKKCKCKKCKIM